MPTTTLSPLLARVQRARLTLLFEQPYFGELAMRLKMVEDDSMKFAAMTNGIQIRWSPSRCAKFTDRQMIGVLAHEVMHCACGHPWRRDAREPKRWNIACDYTINPIIVDAGMKLPDGCLLDDQWRGRNAEYVFDHTPQPDSDGSQDGSGDGTDGSGDTNGSADGSDYGGVEDAPTGDDPTTGEPYPTEQDWRQASEQAASRSRGSMSGGMRRAIDAAQHSSVDWESLLARFLQELTNADYTWQHPNKRYVQHGLYLPSLRSQACGSIVIGIDTSASIDQILLSKFGGALERIFSTLQPRCVTVIYCDTSVDHVDTFERGDAVTFNAVGGGGTDFRPVFEHVASMDEQPAVLVYFTDLDGSFPGSEPEYPVVWAAYGRTQSVPFGDVITLE